MSLLQEKEFLFAEWPVTATALQSHHPSISSSFITVHTQRTNERKNIKRFNTMALPPQVIVATEKIETFMEKYPTLTQNGKRIARVLMSSQLSANISTWWEYDPQLPRDHSVLVRGPWWRLMLPRLRQGWACHRDAWLVLFFKTILLNPY